MALPSPKFYTTGDVLITTHDFGSVEAGAYKPDSTGWKFRLWNDKGGTLGSDDMTSVKISVRDDDGGTDEVWTQQHWVQIKSSSGSTGVVDDAQTVFTAVGKNKELSLGDIPSDEYRTLFARCYPPTDAAEQDVEFQLKVTYQQPATSICNWITGLRGNGVVASTGDPFAMSTGGSTGTIPYEAGYALIYNNEIYYGSSGSYDITTTGSGTYKIYLNESGAFGETTGSVAVNQLELYEATISSGVCTALTDKRVYLAGLQSGTTGAMPSTPDLGDLYLDITNGKLYAAKTAGAWTVIVPGATFVALTDTPASYTSKAGNLVKVTTGADALEFTTDFSDYADSAMIISGGEISVGTSGGTFKVSALTAALRETSGATDILKYKTLAEQDNQTITAADTTYNVILTYATGDPTLSISETVPNENNAINIGLVRKTTGDAVHFCNCGSKLQSGVGKLHKRADSLRAIELASGCTITYSGTDNVDIAPGVVYKGINRTTPFSTGAFESSGADTFTYVGQSTGAAGWLYTTGVSVIDYDHYDDGTTGLGSITALQYSCHWVYLNPDDEHVYVVYGRDTYKIAEAEVADAPTIPDLINDFTLLLGKIIAPEAGGSFTTVQMVIDTFFTGTAVATHNDLGGLDSGNYQHLTQAEHDEITEWAGAVTLSTGGAINLVTFSTGGTVNIPSGAEYQINGAKITSDALSDVVSIGMLDENEVVTGEWTIDTDKYLNFRDTNVNFYSEGSGELTLWASVKFVLATPLINYICTGTGTRLDFQLKPGAGPAWTGGTLITASLDSAGTFTDDVVGMLLDFNTNITMTTDKDVTGYQVKLPAFTQSSTDTTLITGFDLPTAGALVQDTATGTITWKGFNLQLPDTTQTTGTVNAYGIHITPGTINSGTQVGMCIDGTMTIGIDLGANSIAMTGSIGETGSRVTKGWFTDLECTNVITVNGSQVLTSSGAFTENYIPQISTTGGVLKASPFAVTTGDVFDFGAHSAVFTEQAIATTTGEAAINWNLGNKALFTRSTGAAGAATFSFTAPVKSANLMLIIRGSTAGSTGTITWPTVYWQDGLVPVLTSGVSAIDAVSFYYSTGLTAYLGLGSVNFSIA